jgi:lipoate-protein ligase A
MHLLDLTMPTPAENLACDEALLDWFEQGGGGATGGAMLRAPVQGDGMLRFWEPENYFVVVGYGNQVRTEVNVGACEADRIPVLRRCSGGGTVLQGPGCLNYSLVLKIEEDGPLHSITSANRFIMERNRAALELKINPAKAGEKLKIAVRGHTDLALDPRPSTLGSRLKFSGNSQRRKKHYLLFHGAFLLQFDIALIEKYLRMPSKEPDYRGGRSHKDFLMNLELSAASVKEALREAWGARDPFEPVPREAIALLARDKYVTKEWNLKF